jgi:polyhydroxyalkanoate synthesis regulator phasin
MFTLKDILEIIIFIITIIGSLTSFLFLLKKFFLKEISFKIDNLDNKINNLNKEMVKNNDNLNKEMVKNNDNLNKEMVKNNNNLNKEIAKNNNNLNKEIDTIKNNHIFHINKDIQFLKEDVKELKAQQSIIIELLKSLVEKK